MIKNIVVGIDVGTYATRVVIGEYIKGENTPRIIGTGMSESKGLRHGYITNMDDAIKSIRRALIDAEKSSGVKINKAFLSIGGVSLGSEIGLGSAVISKADSEVTSLDVNKSLNESENGLQFINKKVIHAIPISYKLDGRDVLGRPEGMHGIKLEVKTLFVTCLEQHLDDLVTAVIKNGVEVVDIVASPLALSLITLTEKQKAAGCALVDIGAETVSLAVFENNSIISLGVLPIGSTDITNDIALGLKIPLEQAEDVKTGHSSVEYPKKKLDQIIEARLSDIFELVENHLKKIKRNGLLPAGIIITGGGSFTSNIENLAKNSLKIPAKTGGAAAFANTKNSKLHEPAWFVASGLCIYGRSLASDDYTSSSLGNTLGKIKGFFSSLIRQLLP